MSGVSVWKHLLGVERGTVIDSVRLVREDGHLVVVAQVHAGVSGAVAVLLVLPPMSPV